MRHLIALFFLFSLSVQNLEAVGFDDALFPEIVPSGRALGMGNSFVARVDDESAPFHNPAGLGTTRHWSFHLSNFLVEANESYTQDVGNDVGDSVDILKGSFDLNDLRKFHQKSPGQFTQNRLSLVPNFTARYLSFGYFHSRTVRSFYGGESGDSFEFAHRVDQGPYLGTNLSFSGGIMKVGASIAWLNRKEMIGAADVTQRLTPTADQKAKGSMTLTTVGARLTLPVATLPSFAATVHNSSGSRFSKSDDYDLAPTEIVQNVVLGASITPRLGRSTKLHLEVNYRDANKKYTDLEKSHRWSFGSRV